MIVAAMAPVMRIVANVVRMMIVPHSQNMMTRRRIIGSLREGLGFKDFRV